MKRTMRKLLPCMGMQRALCVALCFHLHVAIADESPGNPPETAAGVAAHEEDAGVHALVEIAGEKFKNRDYQAVLKLADAVLMLSPDNQEAKDLANNARRKIVENRRIEIVRDKEIAREQAINEIDAQFRRPLITDHPPRPTKVLTRGMEDNTTGNIEELLDQRIGMNLLEAELPYILDKLFQASGINIIANQEDLEGIKLTIRVEDMPVRDILDFIAQNVGLIYHTGKNAVWLMTPQAPLLESAVFHLAQGLTTTGQTPFQEGAADEDAKDDVSKIVQWMETWPTWPAGSSWSYDLKTNSLFVHSTPEMLKKVEEMVRAIDTPPVQVSIEARFVTVGVDDLRELGIDWQLSKDLELKFGDDGSKVEAQRGSGVELNEFLEEGLTLNLAGVLSNFEFDAVLHALAEDQDSNTLSVPQVTVLSNETAKLTVGEQFPFPTSYRELNSPVVSQTTTVSVPSGFVPVVESIQLGAVLTVTPSVGADLKTIHLQLEPSLTEFVRFVEYSGVFTTPEGDVVTLPGQQYPVIDERTVTTKVVVADGSTVVMGGLIDETEIITQRKVPFLGDIPFLGWFFKSETRDIVKSNLLIFVTAKIITPTGAGYHQEKNLGQFSGQSWSDLEALLAPSRVERISKN